MPIQLMQKFTTKHNAYRPSSLANTNWTSRQHPISIDIYIYIYIHGCEILPLKASNAYLFNFYPSFHKGCGSGHLQMLEPPKHRFKPNPTSHPPCESGPCAQLPQHWQESSHCHHLLHQVKMVKMSKCRTSLVSCDSFYQLEEWMH